MNNLLSLLNICTLFLFRSCEFHPNTMTHKTYKSFCETSRSATFSLFGVKYIASRKIKNIIQQLSIITSQCLIIYEFTIGFSLSTIWIINFRLIFYRNHYVYKQYNEAQFDDGNIRIIEYSLFRTII